MKTGELFFFSGLRFSFELRLLPGAQFLLCKTRQRQRDMPVPTDGVAQLPFQIFSFEIDDDAGLGYRKIKVCDRAGSAIFGLNLTKAALDTPAGIFMPI